ncbi:hypothetical protein GCM10010149_29780 [Nonomuraea roseoviolacea subsp. roseoviolacea]|uniref:DivIVA domain-containing protein n=1 Tax=Nonomuraea roseoviolacea subsp. carminata TaxID=160689 RepID=A0ABT1K4H6_9ACTN|nr:hypothetical protein [Nonomuraea roseoviolacea]MCP2348504.1 hypothetical protein [Nonomuraea roseoviolacea subsp. carminata]
MLVILAIAALAILACVVLVSLGRGGELTEFPPDVPPLDLPEAGRLTAVDFMALQLPVNLVGYHTQSVDETLRRAASAISARDTRIAVLEQRVSELMSSRLHARQELYASPGGGPRTDHEPEGPAELPSLPENGDPVVTTPAASAPVSEAVAEGVPPAELSESAEPAESGELPESAQRVEQPEPEAEAVPERAPEPVPVPMNDESDKGDEQVEKDEKQVEKDGKSESDVQDEGEERPVRAAAGKDGDERA